MKAVTLRGFRGDDIKGLARLWHDSWLSTGLSNANDPTLEQYEDRLATEGRQNWSIHVAIAENSLLGFLAYQTEPNWLCQLFIKPSMKRQGIGTLLLEKAKHDMPGGFWLRTNAENLAARQFYQTRGLRFDGEAVHPTFGQKMARYTFLTTASYSPAAPAPPPTPPPAHPR